MPSTKLTLVSLFTLILLSSAVEDNEPKRKGKDQNAANLPPCAACDTLVKSFEACSEKVSKFKYEDDEKLKRIFKDLCHDVTRGKNQCNANQKEWKDKLEEWWKNRDDYVELRQWLCVDQLQVCCPPDHYGPECMPCEIKDDQGRICSGNGKCKGSGTKKGNGKCACDLGFTGGKCTECSSGFYQSYKDDATSTVLCSACHKSCLTACTGPGAKSCTACKSGFKMDTEHGCADIDECAISRPCAGNKFCVNTEGAYRCLKCDKACDGCDGDGPDNCAKCAEGYTKAKDGVMCVTEQAAGKIFTISNTRFFTYIGLCIAACIIFQKSVAVAGVLGVVIAVYITVSEYYLQGATGELKPI